MIDELALMVAMVDVLALKITIAEVLVLLVTIFFNAHRRLPWLTCRL